MSNTLGCLTMRDLGFAKVSFGYAINDRWTILVSLGLNLINVSKSLFATKKFEQEEKNAVPTLGEIIYAPLCGIELEYQFSKRWYGILGLQSGGIISQTDKGAIKFVENLGNNFKKGDYVPMSLCLMTSTQKVHFQLLLKEAIF